MDINTLDFVCGGAEEELKLFMMVKLHSDYTKPKFHQSKFPLTINQSRKKGKKGTYLIIIKNPKEMKNHTYEVI